jgi:hypothetical protein
MVVIPGPFDNRHLLGKVIIEIVLYFLHFLGSELFRLAKPASVLLFSLFHNPLHFLVLQVFFYVWNKLFCFHDLQNIVDPFAIFFR